MSTRRDRIRDVFDGRVPETPPVSMRLDIWHTHAADSGTIPKEIEGMGVEQVEDYLGFCRSARYRTNLRIGFPEAWEEIRTNGDLTITRWSLPGETLERVFKHSSDEKRAGMAGQIAKYPASSQTDCRALLDALPEAFLAADFAGFDDFDRRTGESGLPLLIVGPCPADYVMIELMGYENFFYALHDYPDLLDALVGTLEEKFRTHIWPRTFDSSAELVLHGTHFSDATTPPPVFKRYILPYFREFNSAARNTGKKVLWHADAGMGLLLQDVMEAGFDGADCLATSPLVPQTIEDYWNAWGGRIVCWGGLPGIVFQPEYPELEFQRHLSGLREFSRGKPGMVIGASDNVMPGAVWDRVLAVRDAFVR